MEIPNGASMLENVASSGQVLMHDQWMINGIEPPNPPFSTLKPREEKNDGEPLDYYLLEMKSKYFN